MHKIKNNHTKDEKSSQIVSWGHWFTLFNIFLVIILGSRYILLADWPSTFMGRFYAIISSLGHFSFLTFAVYLILLFPLSFFIHSQRWNRIIATVVATIGITLLLIDIEVFARFRMHLNLTIWDILTSTEDNILNADWQKLFIFVPLIFFIETVFSIWSWKKLRSLSKRKFIARPIVVILVLSFLSSHIIHIWADANFYRPITMQRASYPLSNPLTARHFLEKYGFLNPGDYSERAEQEGNHFAVAVEYPLSRVSFDRQDNPYNLLLIVMDGLPVQSMTNDMPFLTSFSGQNSNYTQHYSSSNRDTLGVFSLFYGLDPNYYNSILASHTSSVLLDGLTRQRYNLGLFSTDGFNQPLYRHALLSNFSLPKPKFTNNGTVTKYWEEWLDNLNQSETQTPWFSFLNYQVVDKERTLKSPATMSEKEFSQYLQKMDNQIKEVITHLEENGQLNNTVVVITAAKGLMTEGQKVVLSNDSDLRSYDRESLHVPLVISWPTQVNQMVDTRTTHTDIMQTLMQNLLQAKTSPAQYSQGMNLFDLSTRNWLIAGNESEVAALYEDKTIVIDSFGHYRIYDTNNELQKDEKLSLSIFLQLITTNRRFMVTN
ncbi:DUF3413 domain-containing protein [Zophobihabitans entericus]|uniref:DUF3413 domain-containing protein n=1 Tax=Zophobihabitans entericus TaxID=1635327 RepID=A0A6G9IC13_9GAMM|nr:DUF3413 domain-containing protein [Zophobihabitans entericus]QIQ21753.1 DUF3413 domain-containing protein [Zophobihabitans entericus]